MSVRQTINGKNHRFKAEQILNIFNAVEKNKVRWNKCKDKYFDTYKDSVSTSNTK